MQESINSHFICNVNEHDKQHNALQDTIAAGYPDAHSPFPRKEDAKKELVYFLRNNNLDNEHPNVCFSHDQPVSTFLPSDSLADMLTNVLKAAQSFGLP